MTILSMVVVINPYPQNVLNASENRCNNPKGNADTERIMRTLKEECLWLREWTCPFDPITALDAWIADYNEHYLHSALGYKPPRQFEREYHASHGTQFTAA